MRILHLVHRYHPVPGGSERYVQQLAEGCVREGDEVTVLTTDAWDFEHLFAPGHRSLPARPDHHGGVRVCRFPVRHLPPRLGGRAFRGLRRGVDLLPGSEPLAEALAMLRPRVPALGAWLRARPGAFDLVHTTNIELDSLVIAGARYADREGIPHVCTAHVHTGTPADRRRALRRHGLRHQRRILRRAEAVIAQTRAERAFLVEMGVAGERIHLSGGWIRPGEVAGGVGERIRRELGVEGPIVLSIGAASAEKGTIHLAEAVRRLRAAGRECTLLVVAASVLPDFAAYLAGLAPADREGIVLLPSAPDGSKRDALAAASVFALPSRTDTFGIVVLEAWACGLPVVVANAGGLPSVVDHGRTGLLVEYGDVAGLQDALARLLDDPARARRLGRRGREEAGRYTFERAYRRVREAYAAALTRRSGAGARGRR